MKIIKILSICMVMLFVGASISITTGISENEKTISFYYEFDNPVIVEEEILRQVYHTIELEGLNTFYEHGKPVIPMKTVKILIPKNEHVTSIQVEHDNAIILAENLNLFPGQLPINTSDNIFTEFDSEIYNSDEPFPEYFYESMIQYSHGFKILIINLFPVKCIPKDGIVMYYPWLKLNIDTQKDSTLSPTIRSCRMNQNDIEKLGSVENLGVINEYGMKSEDEDIVNGMFEYIVITNEFLRDATGEYTFHDLIDSKINKGVSATIVTIEDIVACTDYWWDGIFGDDNPNFNDTQCKIRNFIKDAYENMGTEYILLGGDSDEGNPVVPHRIFSICIGEVYNIPSDLYYGCLDGSFDSNLNGVFGEDGDGYDIDSENGHVDLFADVLVGRACVENANEISNFVMKTLAYESSQDDYLHNIWMVANRLGSNGPSIWGGNFKDEVKDGINIVGTNTVGIPPEYNVNTLYDRDWINNRWPKSEIVDVINNGVHIINYAGHGNCNAFMEMNKDDVMSLINDNYYLIMSPFACHVGSFDNNDSIIEYHTVKTSHGAFACIANTRAGWCPNPCRFQQFSPHFDREFFDALYGENIRCIGRALQDAKEETVGSILSSISGYKYYQMIYYELTLFGDPEICIKEPPIYDHDLMIYDIDFSKYLVVDTQTWFNVTIYNRGKNNEMDVTVNLKINNIIVDNIIVPLVQSQDFVNVSLCWTFDLFGNFDVTIDILSDEDDYLLNNIKVLEVKVVHTSPVKAIVLDSLGTEIKSYYYKYEILNNEWDVYGSIPIEVDFSSFSRSHGNFTYDELQNSGADILIIDSAMYFNQPQLLGMFDYEYTHDEIDAVIRYVSDGHGIIIIGQSFNGNNSRLFPLVGIKENLCTPLRAITDGVVYEQLVEDHPFFRYIPDHLQRIEPRSLVPYDDYTWDYNDLDNGSYLALGSLNNGAIIMNNSYNGAVYIGLMLSSYCCCGEYSETMDNYDYQLLYNAMTWSNNPEGHFVNAHGEYSAITNTPIQFNGSTYGGMPPLDWTWDFGDGNVSHEQNPVYSYSQEGVYDIVLTVIDGSGNVSIDITKADIADVFVLNLNKDLKYHSIQNAIDDANDGDVIFAPKHTYHENISITKSISLIGENRVDTIIDGVIRIKNNILIKGFTIKNSNDVGILILSYCHGNSIIDNSIIIDNALVIVIGGSSYNNLIYRNHFTTTSGNMIAFDGGYDNTWYNESIQEGNYWSDFKENEGYPDYYKILGSGYSVDLYPIVFNIDVNNDGTVDPLDVGYILSRFGPVTEETSRADVNRDGVVDPLDLDHVLSEL